MKKTAKRRQCPAVGHEITSIECGTGRGTRYACPPECLFSPFAPANYSQFLDLEAQVDEATMDRLSQDSADSEALAREIERILADEGPGILNALVVWRTFFATDTSGRTCVQRWEQAGFPGLKHDGQVLLRAKTGLRVALIEVHRVLDAEQLVVVDLFEAQPKPFIVRDRGLASEAVRFTAALTWIYATPHYHRVSGLALRIGTVPSWEPQDVIAELVRHLGGPIEEGPMRRWLAEHFLRTRRALTAVGLERRRQMFAKVDAKFGRVVYELRRPFAECRDRLDQTGQVNKEDPSDGERREGFAEARVWLAGADSRSSASPATAAARAVLGRVLMGQSYWRLQTMGAAQTAELRQRFEAQLGDRVRFAGEQLDDLAKTLAEREPKADLTLVPPRLIESPDIVQFTSSIVPTSARPQSRAELESATVAAINREFLDHPVPALDGLTPRQAARDLVGRPKLIRLMKDRIRTADERSLETGQTYDADWTLRELGLDEIRFDPPPAGRKPRTPRTDADETEDADDADGGWVDETVAQPTRAGLPPAPPLPDRPFNRHEVHERLKAALAPHERAADAISQLEDEGCTLIEDVRAVTRGLVAAEDMEVLALPLFGAWRVFVPAGTRGWNLTRAELREAIKRDSPALLSALRKRNENAFTAYIRSGPQPALAETLLDQLVGFAQSIPESLAPSPEVIGLLGSVLRAAIGCLDGANRRR
jgi:hypothetical protein